MPVVSSTLTEIAIKRISGKAQASTKLGVNQEAIGSNVQSAAQSVFGEAVPNNPSRTLFTAQTNAAGKQVVQYVKFELNPITEGFFANDADEASAGPTTNQQHSYALRLTGSYESETANNFSGKGSGVFVNNSMPSGSVGKLQIVPSNLSSILGDDNPYVPRVSASAGNRIGPADDVDWYLDTFAGILYVQDADSTVASIVPTSIDCFIYTGDMVDTALANGGGSGGGGNAQFISSGSVSASINVGSNDIFKITSGSDDLVTLSTSGGETNFNINGNLVATRYIVSSSVTFMTQSFSSGSTIFGDSFDDTHLFTGSLFITGSQTFTTMSNSSYNEIAYVSKSADGRTELRFSHVIDGGSF
jgi:hypothetical protein